MYQLVVSSTAASDSLQIGRPPFLNGGLHHDFEGLQWPKLIQIDQNSETQFETQNNLQLNVCTSLVDCCSSSQITTPRETESRFFWGVCYGIPWNGLERPIITLGAGIGIVFILLGRRILDGKPGVQGEATDPVSIFLRAERNEVAISISTQPTEVSNENLLNK